MKQGRSNSGALTAAGTARGSGSGGWGMGGERRCHWAWSRKEEALRAGREGVEIPASFRILKIKDPSCCSCDVICLSHWWCGEKLEMGMGSASNPAAPVTAPSPPFTKSWTCPWAVCMEVFKMAACHILPHRAKLLQRDSSNSLLYYKKENHCCLYCLFLWCMTCCIFLRKELSSFIWYHIHKKWIRNYLSAI